MEAFGFIVAVGGWIFLVFFVGASGGYGREVVNLHMLEIATNVIHLGYVIFIGGVLDRGFKAVKAYLSGVPEMRAAYIEVVGADEKTPKELANRERSEPSIAPEELSEEELKARKLKLDASLAKY